MDKKRFFPPPTEYCDQKCYNLKLLLICNYIICIQFLKTLTWTFKGALIMFLSVLKETLLDQGPGPFRVLALTWNWYSVLSSKSVKIAFRSVVVLVNLSSGTRLFHKWMSYIVIWKLDEEVENKNHLGIYENPRYGMDNFILKLLCRYPKLLRNFPIHRWTYSLKS